MQKGKNSYEIRPFVRDLNDLKSFPNYFYSAEGKNQVSRFTYAVKTTIVYLYLN